MGKTITIETEFNGFIVTERETLYDASSKVMVFEVDNNDLWLPSICKMLEYIGTSIHGSSWRVENTYDGEVSSSRSEAKGA